MVLLKSIKELIFFSRFLTLWFIERHWWSFEFGVCRLQIFLYLEWLWRGFQFSFCALLTFGFLEGPCRSFELDFCRLRTFYMLKLWWRISQFAFCRLLTYWFLESRQRSFEFVVCWLLTFWFPKFRWNGFWFDFYRLQTFWFLEHRWRSSGFGCFWSFPKKIMPSLLKTLKLYQTPVESKQKNIHFYYHRDPTLAICSKALLAIAWVTDCWRDWKYYMSSQTKVRESHDLPRGLI